MIVKEMKKLYKQGYRCLVGVDEAGRGPLAGPVVACAVTLKINQKGRDPFSAILEREDLRQIKDSKKLSEAKRQEWYRILTQHPYIEWAVASVSEKVIDKINILEATRLAMRRAVNKLKAKSRELEIKNIDCLIVDGNMSISPNLRTYDVLRNLWRCQKIIPKADEKIFLCMAASIIAKVTRDRIMKKNHKKYPQYGFDKHKGYGTKNHLQALKKYGPCKIHRQSFKPVKDMLLK